MGAYEVYLETSAEGLWMAHVPGLPGCFARSGSREEVLALLPAAITAHHAWLARHGEFLTAEQATTAGQVEFCVVEEAGSIGPFNPGDAAALFAADLEPVDPGEMEDYFRVMGYSRADLLGLVRHLPPALLDWQPFPEWFGLRRVLRHVGNAEEWYVSRLVPPESLPSEWDDDEELSLFEFLEMERRTAVARLRHLTPAERSSVFCPTAWTRNPEEAWTLRKVLRRFVEHEREHTGQVREILDLYRRALVAHLAAAQASLLEPLLGLDERALTREPVMDGRTARDLLADLAARERRELEARTGPGGNGQPVPSWQDGSLDEVLAELAAAQAAWLGWLESVPEEVLFAPSPGAGAASAAAARLRRLEEQAARLAAWREGYDGAPEELPSAPVLRAALQAGRQELVDAAALIPTGEEGVRPVCDHWTLIDVIGHVADWELLGVEGLRHMAAGRAATPLPVEQISDIDAWNEAHVAARCEQPEAQAWADLSRARLALTGILNEMDAAALARRFLFPWNQEGTPYDWLCVYLMHDREHAAGLRAALTLPANYSSS